ncbi:YciI family protein [Youngiibacter multivorans]|uniref:Uncharacterized protein YciI n=1 Tax=Youngiibacter multivorans TaxID=937251 RepID=A0ABS4G8L1_9CLOT|nr:YciI family protein [Youngiibacter multivorans]MBP1920859.1 uncharacterized protein YciI [Youngiibacter multivorans]
MNEKKEYIYVLKLCDRLSNGGAWTVEDEKAVDDHFERLKTMKSEGSLILAGRTQTGNDATFGIVIFEALNDEEADFIMKTDPAVARGVMISELFPYKVALMRGMKD